MENKNLPSLFGVPTASMLFRRINTWPATPHERHAFTVKIFVGPKGSRQDAGQFLCSVAEWGELEGALRAAGDVEVMP